MVSATSWPTVRLSGGSGAGRLGTERLDEQGDDTAQHLEALVEAPEPTVGLVDVVDDRTHLDGRHAGELAGAQHRETLHRLDVAAARPADSRRRPDRADTRRGQHLTRLLEERCIR